MELRYLAEFLMIAQHGSFSFAAEELFVSQASLSKHIQVLEKELGVPLFDRTTRSVRLSNYGQLLLPFAQQVAAQYDHFSAQLKREQARCGNTLGIVSIPVMAQYGITDALYAFQTAHPEILLSVSEREGCQIDQLMAKDGFDLAFNRIIGDMPPDSPYREIPYCTDSLVAILPENHPLASHSVIPLEGLRGDPFLLMDENTLLYHISMDACRAAGFTPTATYKGHRPENLIGLVAQGMGVSLLMDRQAAFYKNPGIVVVALEQPVISRISLLYKRKRPPSAAARTFISFLGRYILSREPSTSKVPEFFP